MGDWIRSWTFFNWLTVIAFIFACISVSNAFLNLRSKFKDWRGAQNKKAFEKRLKQLETLVNTIGVYRADHARYFRVVADFIATALLMSLEAAIAFIFAFILTLISRNDLFSMIMPVLIGLIFLVGAAVHANRLLWLARYVHVPDMVKDEVLNFLSRGAKKGLIPEKGGKEIVDLLIHHNMITMDEAGALQKLVGKF